MPAALGLDTMDALLRASGSAASWGEIEVEGAGGAPILAGYGIEARKDVILDQAKSFHVTVQTHAGMGRMFFPAFLAIEDENVHMHVGALAIFEGGEVLRDDGALDFAPIRRLAGPGRADAGGPCGRGADAARARRSRGRTGAGTGEEPRSAPRRRSRPALRKQAAGQDGRRLTSRRGPCA